MVNAFALNPPTPFNVNIPPTVKLLVNNETPPTVLVIEILLKAALPELIVCAEPPLKVTVFAPGVKVAALLIQFPETFKVPDGAVNVPLVKVTLAAEIPPVEPVNVAPFKVKLPLNDCWAEPAK